MKPLVDSDAVGNAVDGVFDRIEVQSNLASNSRMSQDQIDRTILSHQSTNCRITYLRFSQSLIIASLTKECFYAGIHIKHLK
ncbi:hypothetical protein D3C86_1730210 [compost metagenome]